MYLADLILVVGEDGGEKEAGGLESERVGFGDVDVLGAEQGGQVG